MNQGAHNSHHRGTARGALGARKTAKLDNRRHTQALSGNLILSPVLKGATLSLLALGDTLLEGSLE